MHNALIEAAAENDEKLMDKYFEEGTLSEEEMMHGLKLGVISRGLFPVLCIAAKTDQGVVRLMDFIKGNCPAPNEVEGMKTKDGKVINCDPAASFVGYVFKTTIEQHLGKWHL